MKTKTRCKVSAKSELKAERKESAEGYKSPNRRCWWNKYDRVHFCQIYRENMLRNYRCLLDDDDSSGMRRHYLNWFLSWRLDYRRAVLGASRYKSVLPLP